MASRLSRRPPDRRAPAPAPPPPSPAAWSCASATATTQRTKLRSAGIRVAVGLQRDPDPVERRRPRCRRAPRTSTSSPRGAPRAAASPVVGEVAQRGDDVLALGAQQREARRSWSAVAQVRLVLVDERERSGARAPCGPRRARPPRPGARSRTRGSSRASGSAAPPRRRPAASERCRPAPRGGRATSHGRAVVADGRRALRRHAAGEDREPLGERALGVGQQVPAPVDDGAQRAVARQRGAAAAGEQPEAVVEPRGDLSARHRAQPRGGQLDGQRQAVEPAADLDDRGDVVRVDGEAGRRRRAAVGEQLRPPDRRAPRRRRRVGGRARPAAGPRPARSPTMPSGSRLVARMRTPGQRAEQLVGEAAAALDQVLAVVEDEQGGRGRRARRRTRCIASRRRDARRGALEQRRPRAGRARRAPPAARSPRLADRGELDQPDAVRAPSVRSVRAGLAGQPGLAGAARADQRDEPVVARAASATRSSSSSRPTKLVSGARRFVRAAAAATAGVGGRRGRPRRAGRRGARPAAPATASTPSSSSSAARDALVGGQRVGLPAGGGQRADLQPRARARRSGWSAASALELGDELARARRRPGRPRCGRSVAASRSSSSRAAAARANARVPPASASAGPRHSASASPSVAAAPAGLAGAQRARALARRARSKRCGVDVVGLEREPVAARRLRRTSAASPSARRSRETSDCSALHLVGRARRRSQTASTSAAERDRAPGVEREPREQRPQPGPADLERAGRRRRPRAVPGARRAPDHSGRSSGADERRADACVSPSRRRSATARVGAGGELGPRRDVARSVDLAVARSTL